MSQTTTINPEVLSATSEQARNNIERLEHSLSTVELTKKIGTGLLAAGFLVIGIAQLVNLCNND